MESSSGGVRGWFGVRAASVEAPRDEVDGERAADEADVRETLGGDGEGFARIVKRHQRRLAGYLLRFTADRGVVEELLQETFVRAHGSLGGYRGEARLGVWLAKIATRVGYRYWRARDRERGRFGRLMAWVRGRGAAEEAPEVRDEVERALGKLSARDRLALTLIHMEGRSVEEAAYLTGWSASMVKVQTHRARERFRAVWGELGGDER